MSDVLTTAERSAAERLIEETVTLQAAVLDQAEKYKPQVIARFKDLLSNPEELNDEITLDFIEAELEITDLSDDVWETIADLQDATFEELHAVPRTQQGEAWEMARQIRVAVAWRQALIESGLIADILAEAIDSGAAKAAIGRRFDLGEIVEKIDLKKQIKEARNNGDSKPA
jgi:hypothetical protein